MTQLEPLLEGRGLSGVVNNAGIGVPGPLETIPIEDLRRQLEVNVLGQVAVTQAVLPLIRKGSGRILFVGSVGGVLASQFAGAYHASKFAIEAIGDVWRQELDPEEIPVILIEPSAISTPIWDKAIAQLDRLLSRDPAGLARYRDRLTAFQESLHSADEHGKSPEDVADVIATALTEKRPDARYVVGGAGKLATALRPLVAGSHRRQARRTNRLGAQFSPAICPPSPPRKSSGLMPRRARRSPCCSVSTWSGSVSAASSALASSPRERSCSRI